MDLSVNNMPSLSHTLYGITQDITTSQMRLSTGLRINSSQDDASGVAKVSTATSEINENDVIVSDLAKTKAINDYYGESMSNLLGQMQDIMVLVDQAKDSNITPDERTAIQNDIDEKIIAYNNTVDSITYNGVDLLDSSAVTLNVSKNGSTIASNDTQTSSNLKLTTIDVGTAGDASTAYANLSASSGQETLLRTEYLTAGTSSKSMEIEAERLMKVNAILETSRSQIQDVDVAEETANLTKNQILNQATTTVMGQANTIQTTALTLMNGLFS